MLYAIHVKQNKEADVDDYLTYGAGRSDLDFFTPIYEKVERTAGRSRISFERMFPEYLFVETGNPKKAEAILKNDDVLAKLIDIDDDGELCALMSVNDRDEEFIRQLLCDGFMHVSYIHMSGKYIDRLVGPLENYREHITRLDIDNRIAVIESTFLGQRQKIKFGLWTDEDPTQVWLDKRINPEKYGIYDISFNEDGYRAWA